MNTLSWFLYWAGIVDPMKMTFIFIALGLGILSVIIYFHSEGISGEEGVGFKRIAKRVVLSAAILTVITIFIPSSRTLYLILGSEAAEAAVQSETGKKIQKIINQQLDKFLLEDNR